MDVQVDTISMGADGQTLIGNGEVAEMLVKNNFNVNALRPAASANGLQTNAVLRKDEWSRMDQILLEIARKRLVAVDALTSRGLSYDVPNGLGTTILEWEQVSDMDPANVDMSGVTEGEKDRIDFALQSMPLPIIHKDFSINIRALAASRTTGQPLDTAQIAMASTLVTEKVEEMVFLGHATRQGASRIWGLSNHPDRNTGSVAANWDLVGTTGEQKLGDLIAMVSAAAVDNMYGPFGVFIPQAAYNFLGQDFKTNSDKATLSRLMELVGIDFIKPSKDVPAGAVLMVQLSSDVIDEVIGLQPTVVQWDSKGGMIKNFKVMAIMIPRVRSTITSQSGLVHYS